MKWYQHRCVNKRDYLLEHMEEWSMNNNELMLLLVVDYMNQYHMDITYDVLARKLKLSTKEVESLYRDLNEKGYLDVLLEKGRIIYSIEGIFEDDAKAFDFDGNVFDQFEMEFKRPLSQREIERLSDWMKLYERKLIGYALREASTYDVLNFDYIERILLGWKEKNLSAADYEKGKR